MPSASLLQRYPRMPLAYAACGLLLIGLLFSKFTLTLGMLLLLTVALVSPTPKADWTRLRRQPAHWGSMAVFILFLGSALVSDNAGEAWVRVRIALPLLAMPLAFGLLPPFSDRVFHRMALIFVYSMSLTGLGVLLNYLWHYEVMQDLLRVSKAIPTPNGEHIRFSLLLDWALLMALWARVEWQECLSKGHRWLLPLVAFFLFALLHILAVRIGLVIGYAGLGALGGILLWQRRRYGILLLGLVSLLVLPFLAYRYVPSVRTKIQLTRYNWQLYQRGEYGPYSDTRRLLSYQVGLEVAQQAPYWGVGIGDLNDEQAAIYQQKHPDQKIMYPHNLYLTIYASMGAVGLVLFLLFFYGPLFIRRHYRHPMLVLFYLLISLSFLTENTLLTALGVGIFSGFNGWLMQQLPLPERPSEA